MQFMHICAPKTTTGELRYVKLAYLENTTCVEVIVHFRIFLLYFIVFRPCLCRTRLCRKLGCIKVIVHSCEKFSISFTTGCVKVKFCTVIGRVLPAFKYDPHLKYGGKPGGKTQFCSITGAQKGKLPSSQTNIQIELEKQNSSQKP